MKITVSQLRKIIQEEVQQVNESGGNPRIVNQYDRVVGGIESRVNDIKIILDLYERFKSKNYYQLIGSLDQERESTEGKQNILGMIKEMESLMWKINNLSGMLSNLEAPFNQLKIDLESQLVSTPEPKPELTQAQKRLAILKNKKP